MPGDPGETTTTTEPATEATTTTTVPAAPTDTTPATVPSSEVTTPTAETTTTTTEPPPPPEDLDSTPVAPPVEAPNGRVVLPAGVVDSGQVRPITFPVAGPVTYVNDFGACRDGCARAHKGNDVIGDRLQPLLAMRDGVVDRLLDHPTAGFGIVIRDTDGWEYHLYHANNDSPATDDGADDGSWRFAPGIVPGAPVQAGQLVAWMGDSGNSEGSVPHAHVEIHRPDGSAVNPYWSLRRAQRDVNCGLSLVEADPAAAADPSWLESAWRGAALPTDWIPLALTGGRPGSDETAARMWVGPQGFTAVDGAALRVGDGRYDEGVDCAQPAEQPLPPMPIEIGAILATIRAMESGADYTVQVTTSTASGAYGFLDSSWGGYGGYWRARDAPPPVQDAKAAELAMSILARNAGDISTIPVSWYIGHVPRGTEWDRVPPYPGNRLTPREYQDRWLARYAEFLGSPELWVGNAAAWTPVDTTRTCHTVVVDLGRPGTPQYAFTQAQRLVVDTTNRAVPAPTDPCDPSRGALPAPAPVAVEAPVSGPR